MGVHLLALVSVLAAGPALGDGSGEAGDAPRRTAGLVLGLRADAVREDLLVPLTFAGPGFRLGGFFRGWVGPGLLVAQASFGFAPLFNRFGQLAATVDYGLDAAWLLPLHDEPGWHLGLGPMLAWDTRVTYLYAWDDAHGYWLGTWWLGPAASFTGRLAEGWRLEASASFALLGLEGRPPAYRFAKQEAVDHLAYWFAAPAQDLAFVTPARLQAVRLALAVRPTGAVASAPGTGWSFGAEARFSRTDVPLPTSGLAIVLFAARAWGTP